MSRAREVSKIVLTVDSIEDNIDLSATITTASSAAVSAISDGAPENLNTLNELSSAINNDDNFYSTVENTYLDKSSASTTYTAKIDHQPSFRNLIINGAMQVAQRGTSTTGITTMNYYTADRWSGFLNTLGTWTQTVENDAPTGSGFRKSLKMLCTTADATPDAGDSFTIIQRFEGQNVQSIRKGTANAQQLTLSFWVKSNVTGTYIVELQDVDNTRAVSASYSVASSGTWEKKTITFPADTTGALDNDNALSLTSNFYLSSGTDRTSGTLNTSWASIVAANRAVGQTNLAAATNNYWQVTGVQLEVGAVATPFEFKPFAQELAECQRYYYDPLFERTTAFQTFALGYSISTSQGLFVLELPVSMRTAPSLTITAADFLMGYSSGSNSTAPTGITIVTATNNNVHLSVSGATSMTANIGYQIYRPGTSSRVQLTAEL